ncbi:MAG: hypothetical protein WBB82_05585 [Limnothrix sp.]
MIDFFGNCRLQLITSEACVTEVMWLLAPHVAVQNDFLEAIAADIFRVIPLTNDDYKRIATLNKDYQDLPGDFADLALVAISERLDVSAIATLDKDFDIYRRYGNQAFERVFYPQ